ncbi:hypothetical protein CHARACLAT_000747 [Characodon lateralis]|uniref:Uncharacterized protein n=1 Tax=Characodon lateralis TaxID=208331 RepID=A0ABU7DP27_9TELE|nr:hypothetical protein [Characodon lateralis]
MWSPCYSSQLRWSRNLFGMLGASLWMNIKSCPTLRADPDLVERTTYPFKVWEKLGISQNELESVTGDWDVRGSLLHQLPLRPSIGKVEDSSYFSKGILFTYFVWQNPLV